MNRFSRRNFLSAASAVTAGTVFLPTADRLGFSQQGQPWATAGPSWKQIGQSKGILVGSTAVTTVLAQDPNYGEVLTSQCDVLVPEWEAQFGKISPKPFVYDFSKVDQLQQFAQQHGMKFRINCLIWHNGLPTWFQSYVNKGNAQQIFTNFLTTSAQHFAGKIWSWDVVNEVIHVDNNYTHGLRSSSSSGTWYQLLGPDYVPNAFKIVHQADSNALLVMNENYMEEDDNPGHQQRRDSLLYWLTTMVKQGVPVQALGLQSHLRAGHPGIAGPKFQQFLSQVSDLGLKILVSEIDVDDTEIQGDIPTRDQKVADTYYYYLTNVLKQKSCIAVIVWGLSDKYSWLKNQKNKAGQTARPLPYDANWQPKKAYYAIQKALMEASSR